MTKLPLQRVPFAVADDFFKSQLGRRGPLGEYILQHLSRSLGCYWVFAPDDWDAQTLSDLAAGGKVATILSDGREYVPDQAEALAQQLRSLLEEEPSLVLVIEDSTLSRDCQSDSTTVLDDWWYRTLTSTESCESIVDAIRDATAAVAFLCAVFRSSYFHAGLLEDPSLAHMMEQVAISAYDDESYLIWTRGVGAMNRS